MKNKFPEDPSKTTTQIDVPELPPKVKLDNGQPPLWALNKKTAADQRFERAVKEGRIGSGISIATKKTKKMISYKININLGELASIPDDLIKIISLNDEQRKLISDVKNLPNAENLTNFVVASRIGINPNIAKRIKGEICSELVKFPEHPFVADLLTRACREK